MAPLPPCHQKRHPHPQKSAGSHPHPGGGAAACPRGGILPAQIGGVPVIPGSSVRGALLSWLNTIWATIPNDEQAFLAKPSCRLTTAVGSPAKSASRPSGSEISNPFPSMPSKNGSSSTKKANSWASSGRFSPNPNTVNPDKFVLQVQLPQTPHPRAKSMARQPPQRNAAPAGHWARQPPPALGGFLNTPPRANGSSPSPA